ncbi:MAG: hypothetical protein ACP5H3_01675 [Candidatus Aenigmatarchaeota archaeon]|jgi:Zn-dependent protease
MIEFSKEEIIEITIAVLVLTLIFSFRGFYFDIDLIPISFFSVSIAYLLHELAHKFVAIKLGYSARFRLYLPSTLLSIFLAFTGVKVAALGWVEILPFKFKSWLYRRLEFSLEDMGKIALSGPLTNIFLASVFLIFNLHFLKDVNAWMAFFNLLPVPPLDGSKVVSWNFGYWAFFFIFSIFLLII